MIKEKEFAKNIKRIRQGSDSRMKKLRLGMNEYIPHMPEDLFKKIISNFTIEKASAYPEVNQAYNALSGFLNQKRDRILLASGADMAIKIIFETFCQQGDIVATCAPTFAMYRVHANLLNCKLREISSNNKGEFTEEDLLDLANKSTKLIILANPNGVTGFAFEKNLIIKLLEKSSRANTIVVLDETYANFGEIDMSELLEKYNNLIIVRSFSKNIGMAGIRVGYILSSEYLSGMMEKFKPMMEINSLAVESIKTICSDKKYLNDAVQKIIKARKYVSVEFRERGYEVLERKGNFILVNFEENCSKIETILENNNIEYRKLSRPLEKYIRFTVGTKKIMKNLLNIIGEVKNNEKI